MDFSVPIVDRLLEFVVWRWDLLRGRTHVMRFSQAVEIASAEYRERNPEADEGWVWAHFWGTEFFLVSFRSEFRGGAVRFLVNRRTGAVSWCPPTPRAGQNKT